MIEMWICGDAIIDELPAGVMGSETEVRMVFYDGIAGPFQRSTFFIFLQCRCPTDWWLWPLSLLTYYCFRGGYPPLN